MREEPARNSVPYEATSVTRPVWEGWRRGFGGYSGSMKKPLSALLAAMTVTAIILSSGAAYAQLAHQMRVQQNESAEVLKVL